MCSFAIQGPILLVKTTFFSETTAFIGKKCLLHQFYDTSEKPGDFTVELFQASNQSWLGLPSSITHVTQNLLILMLILALNAHKNEKVRKKETKI